MEKSRRCEICIVDVHRASLQKYIRSKKHLEVEKQNGTIIQEWLIKEEQTQSRKKNLKK